MGSTTAAQAGLVSCHTCGKLSPASALREHHKVLCTRCGAPLHQRKPVSIQRTWALLITGLILYVPANVYPIMKVVTLGKSNDSTIISGVMDLWSNGMYPIAIVVFVASILVPVLKFIAMIYLLLVVQLKQARRARQCTVLYRLVEFVGRWSMVDVFVVALLAALVQMGAIAQILPGIGALAFAVVVISTMLAAMSFDPRLIWDAIDSNT